MKFFIAICLFALTAGSNGYRIVRDVSSESNSLEQYWDKDKEAQAIEMLSQYCKNVSGVDDAITKVMEGVEKFVDCTVKHFNPEEIERKLRGIGSTEFDEIFNLYCPRVEKVFTCAEEFKPVAAYCLDSDEMEALTIIINLVKRFTAFVCHNSGEHVIKFIEDGGLECFQEHEPFIYKCVDDTKDKYSNKLKEDLEDDDLEFKVTKEDCDEYDVNSQCVVNALKKRCAKKSISEIMELLFNELKEEFKCELVQNVV